MATAIMLSDTSKQQKLSLKEA